MLTQIEQLPLEGKLAGAVNLIKAAINNAAVKANERKKPFIVVALHTNDAIIESGGVPDKVGFAETSNLKAVEQLAETGHYHSVVQLGRFEPGAPIAPEKERCYMVLAENLRAGFGLLPGEKEA